MKKFIAFAFAALSLLALAPAASAQGYGTYAYCNGAWRWQSCSGSTQAAIPVTQLVAVPSAGPSMYTYNSVPVRCQDLTIAGRSAAVTFRSCERVETRVAVQREYFNNSQPVRTTRIVPAEEQVGGVAYSDTDYGQRNSRPQPTRYAADCDIGGHPELQDLNVSKEKCDAIRNGQRTKVPAKCDFGNGVVAYSYEDRAGRDKIAAAMTRRTEVSTSAGSTVASSQKTSLPAVVEASNPPRADKRIGFCRVETGEKTYRFNAVNGQKFDPDQCTRYRHKKDPLPDESSMSIME